jgi:preprotein translocase subunit SecY
MFSLKSFFSIQELRNKFLFTISIILFYRLGTHMPIPGVDISQISSYFSNNNVLGFINLFSGGALSRFSIFALGILPFINASIIVQLMMVVWPALKELAEEGESGRKTISQYTRYLAIGIAIIQAFVFSLTFKSFILPGINYYFFLFYSICVLTAGAAFVMWLGELVTEKGIGNGASILIFVGIIAQLPMYITNTVLLVKSGTPLVSVFILVAMLLFMIVAIIFVQEAERKIPVQYAKRIVGRKVYAAQNTYIPLRLIQSGVMPIIFASAILQFPLMFAQYLNIDAINNFVSLYFNYNSIIYNVLFCILIFFFTYFYTAITFNPQDIGDNIKKYGGFIMGIRPGAPTVLYLEKIITTLTFIGAVVLSLVALIPIVTANITKVTSFMGLGGTALLILVGVAMDIIKRVDAIVISHDYEGVSK